MRPDKSSLHRLFGRKFKDLSPEDQGDLGARLNGRWVHAIVRSVREILRNEDLSDKDKVRALLKSCALEIFTGWRLLEIQISEG